MRHDKIIAAGTAPVRRAARPCIFTCACCETTEHSPTPETPAGWTVEFIDGADYAFCPTCKLDLQRAHVSAGAMATRIGVISQLDADEIFGCDEEERRITARLAGAERFCRAALPVLIVGIVMLSGACMVSQATRLITL